MLCFSSQGCEALSFRINGGIKGSLNSLRKIFWYMPVQTSIHIYLSIYLSICPSVRLSVCLSAYLSKHLSLSPCLSLSMYLSIYPLVCLPVYRGYSDMWPALPDLNHLGRAAPSPQRVQRGLALARPCSRAWGVGGPHRRQLGMVSKSHRYSLDLVPIVWSGMLGK